MFKVKIDLATDLAGCPGNGLAAADWRTAHTLPAAPTDRVTLKWEGESEPLCREFAAALDGQADLTVTVSPYSLAFAVREVFGHGYSNESFPPVTPDAARPFLAGTAGEDDVRRLLREAASSAARLREATKRKKEDREAKEAAERAEREKAEREKAEAERAARAARQEPLRRWAIAHGSETLRLRIDGGFEWTGLALTEWADQEFAAISGGAAPLDDPEGYEPDGDEPRLAPTLAEMLSLRRWREAVGDRGTAELVLVKYTPVVDEDDDGYPDDDDRPVIHRTEIKVTVRPPLGGPIARYYPAS